MLWLVDYNVTAVHCVQAGLTYTPITSGYQVAKGWMLGMFSGSTKQHNYYYAVTVRKFHIWKVDAQHRWTTYSESELGWDHISCARQLH